MQRVLAAHAATEVRALLARRQITGKQLGTELGLSTFAISRRLRGDTPFSLDELSVAARYLAVPLSSLLAEQDIA